MERHKNCIGHTINNKELLTWSHTFQHFIPIMSLQFKAESLLEITLYGPAPLTHYPWTSIPFEIEQVIDLQLWTESRRKDPFDTVTYHGPILSSLRCTEYFWTSSTLTETAFPCIHPFSFQRGSERRMPDGNIQQWLSPKASHLQIKLLPPSIIDSNLHQSHYHLPIRLHKTPIHNNVPCRTSPFFQTHLIWRVARHG